MSRLPCFACRWISSRFYLYIEGLRIEGSLSSPFPLRDGGFESFDLESCTRRHFERFEVGIVLWTLCPLLICLT